MEVESLRHLKVIRSENPILQALIENYSRIWMDLSYLKNKHTDMTKMNEELVEENSMLRDELAHAQAYARTADKSNSILKANLRQFLHNLEGQGIIAMKEDGRYDVSL